MENFAEAKISLRGESGEERKFFNESFREVRELIKKIYSTRSNRELDLIDPTWSPTFIAIHLFPLSLSLLVSMHALRNKYKDVEPFLLSCINDAFHPTLKEIPQRSKDPDFSSRTTAFEPLRTLLRVTRYFSRNENDERMTKITKILPKQALLFGLQNNTTLDQVHEQKAQRANRSSTPSQLNVNQHRWADKRPCQRFVDRVGARPRGGEGKSLLGQGPPLFNPHESAWKKKKRWREK